MNILLFELISGGGYAGRPLPESLAREGLSMLQALVTGLLALPGIEPVILLDWRCSIPELAGQIRIIRIAQNQSYLTVLQRQFRECELFWPIAPETDGALNHLAEMAAAVGIPCLLSSSDTLAICSSKYRTSRSLRKNRLNAIRTDYLSDCHGMAKGKWVIKPDDGVAGEGSQIIMETSVQQHFMINHTDPGRFVIQPYLPGRALSLSCLFKQGRGWLLTCNEQELDVRGGGFELVACHVNTDSDQAAAYQYLIDRIARAMPGLWGYIGIDLIDSAQLGLVILEINPRLTTSFCGIRDAIGINVAEQVLQLRTGEPQLRKTTNRTVTVRIH